MTIQHNNYPSRIARRAEQGARPAIPPQVEVEKLITEKEKEKRKENKNKNKMKTVQLLNSTKRFKIGPLVNQTLQKVYKITELIASAELTGKDIICIQEHRFIHEIQSSKNMLMINGNYYSI